MTWRRVGMCGGALACVEVVRWRLWWIDICSTAVRWHLRRCVGICGGHMWRCADTCSGALVGICRGCVGICGGAVASVEMR